MRLTEAEYEALRVGGRLTSIRHEHLDRAREAFGVGKAVLSETKMNKTETRYSAHLEYLRGRGEIQSYKFECLKLRLADNTFYTPDFMVVNSVGEIEIHEVKGFWRDDARVKIKVANEQFPFRFIAVTEKKGEWVYERF